MILENRERVTVLSQKTMNEMMAGRAAISLADSRSAMMDSVQHGVVNSAMEPLRKQFPTISGPVHIDWDLKDDPKNWVISIHVQCPNGTFVDVPSPFVGFPDDELISTLMLLVG